jgi:V/A-type H+/Na+-transporting ATPase subunit E
MALEDILGAIDQEADGEVRRVSADTERRRTEMLERAAAEAESILREESERAATARVEHREGILNGARLDADRSVRETRETVYQELLTIVRERLARVADGPDYPRIWPVLFDECRRVLPEARTVRVRASDEGRALSVAIESGMADVEVEPVLDSWGGLELATGDGRLVRNTFEDRLEKADPALRLLAGDLVPELRERRP